MAWYRNYWVYSAGLTIAWAVVLLLVRTVGDTTKMQTSLLLFFGLCIDWVSTTIARLSIRHPSAGTSIMRIGKPCDQYQHACKRMDNLVA
jgi:hypothetical protein